MFKIHRKLEYALMALKHMSSKRPGQLTTAREISQDYHIPFDATARVLQLMAHAGILNSEQGVQGGYQIIKDLTKVSFLDLVESVVGSVKTANCLLQSESGCDLIDSCNIISPMTRLNDRMTSFYQDMHLGELLFEWKTQPETTPKTTFVV